MTTWNPYVFENACVIVPLTAAAFVICGAAGWRRIGRSGKESGQHTTVKFGSTTCGDCLQEQLQWAGRVLLAYWIFTILCATMIGRDGGDERVRMEPFWTIKAAWENRSGLHWYFVIGNIALFVPYGFLLPAAFRRMDSRFRAVAAGFVFSALIEVTQHVLKIGVLEADDLINNTLGSFVGYQLSLVVRYHLARFRVVHGNEPTAAFRRPVLDELFLAVLILSVVCGLFINQPDWSRVSIF